MFSQPEEKNTTRPARVSTESEAIRIFTSSVSEPPSAPSAPSAPCFGFGFACLFCPCPGPCCSESSKKVSGVGDVDGRSNTYRPLVRAGEELYYILQTARVLHLLRVVEEGERPAAELPPRRASESGERRAERGERRAESGERRAERGGQLV
jgi:hypothetical protein